MLQRRHFIPRRGLSIGFRHVRKMQHRVEIEHEIAAYFSVDFVAFNHVPAIALAWDHAFGSRACLRPA